MRKKRKDKKKKGNIIFYRLFFIISLILFISILALNVLDLIHIGLVFIILLVINFIVYLLCKNKKILGYLLCFIFGGIFLFLTVNVSKTVSFLSDLDLKYKTYHYSLVVLKKSSYQSIKDVATEDIGYYDDGGDEIDKAIGKVKKKVDTKFLNYDDTHKLANDLLDEKVNCIMLEDSYLDILNESISKGDDSFKNLIRVIYSFTILTKTSDISHDVDITKKSFNVYISGIDTYGEISSVSRSDVNMVITVNPLSHQILLTSIPRDYYVSLHGKSGYKDKLTHAGLYGVDMSIETIEDLLGIDINYYVKVNFTSVIDIVNALDGVVVNSSVDFTSIDGYHYVKGNNSLNGEEALSFARERKAFAIGDRQRIMDQQLLFQAILKKVTSKKIITKYISLLDSVHGDFVTNMKMSRITSFIRYQIAGNYTWDVSMNSLEGTDSSNYTYSVPSFKSYVMEPKEESVEEAHKKIMAILGADESDDHFQYRVTTSSDDSLEVSEKKVEDNHQKEEEKKLELKANLGKNTVSYVEGEDYVFYPCTVYYGNDDISRSSYLKSSYVVNGTTFTDYQELVLYMSQLLAGNYSIDFKFEYKGSTVSLTQNVVIEKKKEEKKVEPEDTVEEETTSETDNSGEYSTYFEEN